MNLLEISDYGHSALIRRKGGMKKKIKGGIQTRNLQIISVGRFSNRSTSPILTLFLKKSFISGFQPRVAEAELRREVGQEVDLEPGGRQRALLRRKLQTGQGLSFKAD